jgi:DNA-binding XRE family transcriptional regulator
MQANNIMPFSVYSTGNVSRRTLLNLMNGRGLPNLRTMRALAQLLSTTLGRRVRVEELFEINDED